MRVNIPNLKTCLAELADKDFQRRAWLAENGPEISSFSELISQLFDDTGLSDALDDLSLQNVVGRVATAKLQALNKAVSKVDQSLSPSELISLPEMAKIRELARQALKELQ